jgi:hypothetical protein
MFDRSSGPIINIGSTWFVNRNYVTSHGDHVMFWMGNPNDNQWRGSLVLRHYKTWIIKYWSHGPIRTHKFRFKEVKLKQNNIFPHCLTWWPSVVFDRRRLDYAVVCSGSDGSLVNAPTFAYFSNQPSLGALFTIRLATVTVNGLNIRKM